MRAIIVVALLVGVAQGALTFGQGRSEIYERVVADGAPGLYNPKSPTDTGQGRNNAAAAR